MSEEDAKVTDNTAATNTIVEQRPDSITVEVDKTTLERIRERMENKYNNFWGDVIDDEQKRTIEIADKLIPGQPYKINGKDYEFRNVGMRKYRELAKLKAKADKEKDTETQTDLLTEYYIGTLTEFFGMSQDEADRVPPGEARMVTDAAVYKVIHPVPLHPERLNNGSMQGPK